MSETTNIACPCDQSRQGTHWEGCHETHPECAAYRAGFEAGPRVREIAR